MQEGGSSLSGECGLKHCQVSCSPPVCWKFPPLPSSSEARCEATTAAALTRLRGWEEALSLSPCGLLPPASAGPSAKPSGWRWSACTAACSSARSTSPSSAGPIRRWPTVSSAGAASTPANSRGTARGSASAGLRPGASTGRSGRSTSGIAARPRASDSWWRPRRAGHAGTVRPGRG